MLSNYFTAGEPGRILVAVKDDRTCLQLQEYPLDLFIAIFFCWLNRYLELGETTMLIKLWEKYKVSPAVRNKQAFAQIPQGDKWKGQYGKGRGRGKDRGAPKTKADKGTKGVKGRGRGRGRGKDAKTPPTTPGGLTIMDINPVTLSADSVSYVWCLIVLN